MKVAVMEKEIQGLECIERGDKRFYDELMLVWSECDIIEIYFVNVSDETFKKFSDEGDIRVNVDEKELQEYLKTFDYILVYSNKKLKLCFMKHSQADQDKAC